MKNPVRKNKIYTNDSDFQTKYTVVLGIENKKAKIKGAVSEEYLENLEHYKEKKSDSRGKRKDRGLNLKLLRILGRENLRRRRREKEYGDLTVTLRPLPVSVSVIQYLFSFLFFY